MLAGNKQIICLQEGTLLTQMRAVFLEWSRVKTSGLARHVITISFN